MNHLLEAIYRIFYTLIPKLHTYNNTHYNKRTTLTHIRKKEKKSGCKLIMAVCPGRSLD